MSRCGYNDVIDNWTLIKWRGQVASAIRGKRGQAFLREMLAALDALPQKRLIAGALEENGEYCALGAVGRARGLDMSQLDPEDHPVITQTFGIANAMAREIEFVNDEMLWYRDATPERRFEFVRDWVVKLLAGGKP